jgi:hypothetical protein
MVADRLDSIDPQIELHGQFDTFSLPAYLAGSAARVPQDAGLKKADLTILPGNSQRG